MLYDREWVELVDYDWPEDETYPRTGVVRTPSNDKKLFYALCGREPVPVDSAILFTDPPTPKWLSGDRRTSLLNMEP